MKYNERPDLADFDPSAAYTPTQLDAFADEFLREDAKMELCRDCGEPGSETGEVVTKQQSFKDEAGNALCLKFPEIGCGNGHKWYSGEGAMKGIGGKDPILFKEHIDSRKRREIYTAIGTPDPEIVSGIYNRTHPQGRKVNSEEQRKKNGASFFR